MASVFSAALIATEDFKFLFESNFQLCNIYDRIFLWRVGVMYTIKEVAEKLDISEHTLRFWAKSGMFPFVKRNENNIVIYKILHKEIPSLILANSIEVGNVQRENS